MATFILIHGAWHGGWCWESVVPPLEARGHRVLAPDLPGMGSDRTPWAEDVLGQRTDAVESLVEAQQPERVVLVGHSNGGLSVSTVAERLPDRVALAVYLAAFLLADGEAILDAKILAEDAVSGLRPTEDGRAFAVDSAYAREWFYPRAVAAVAERAVSRLVPEPVQPSTARPRLTPARFGQVPRAFIETTGDLGLPLAKQREMQARWPCDPVVTLESDHAPFISMPERLVEVLDALARGAVSER